MSIEYLVGDATNPKTLGNKLIVHCCNDVVAWGKGFVLAISKRWPKAELAYRDWFRNKSNNDFALGSVQLVQVEPDIWIANLIGQNGIRSKSNLVPIRYDAIEQSLEKIAEFSITNNASIHMPRIGCGLAGGNWQNISTIIDKTLINKGVSVTVYDFQA